MGTKNAKGKKQAQTPPKQEATAAVEEEGQLELIDVTPENQKIISGVAKRYKKAQTERLAALEVETSEKQRLLELIKKAKLQPLEGGMIRFRVDGLLITVTPRDELIRITDESEGTAEE